jgi:diguanylate cyclase (GGDEF)-like protein
MPIQSVRQLIVAEDNGGMWTATWRKAPTQVTTANVWYDMGMATGNPAPNYYASAPLIAKTLKRSEDGGLDHGPNPGVGQTKYLKTFCALAASGVPITFVLADYLLFYPLALLGLQFLTSSNQKLTVLEIVDASIVGLGLSTLGSALALHPVLPHFGGDFFQSFLAIIYPVADLVLLCFIIATVALQGFSTRGAFLSVGVAVYATTDFLFLWKNLNSSYVFGSLIDYGWLLAFVLIAESCWHPSSDNKSKGGISPVLITISVFLSATLLALLAIAPGNFPHFVLIPAIGTLALAFIRMSIALHQARSIGHERILARTDELTMLPNRRRLIAEIQSYSARQGSLLLLDLDGFKPVNDTYGHEVGDRVLQQVSQRFSRALPDGSLLARLGGDEFGVLVDGTQAAVMEIALALRGTLSYPFLIDGQEILIGVSIGIADNNGADDLLLRADNAMYAAKRQALGVCQL